MTKKYIIYHDKCLDGITSAAIFKNYIDKYLYNEAHTYTFIPGSYDKTFKDYPDMTDGVVYFLDFCFKRECFISLLNVVQRIIVIDHHKSSTEMLKEFNTHYKVILKLDNKHCGCYSTYTYLYPDPKEHNKNIITLLNHIEDVDIWLHRDSNSKYIVLALCQHLTIDNMYSTYKGVEEDAYNTLSNLSNKGYFLYKQLKGIAKSEKENSFVRDVGHYGSIRFINNTCKQTQAIHSSDFLDTGIEDTLIFFSYTGNGVRFSIRSNGKVDCTSIASFISSTGGGHIKASGAFISNQYPLLLAVHPIIRLIQDPSYTLYITRKQKGVV